ncbi:MAG: AAA family ATPase [Desulfovibrionaceae bacterium]
MSLAGKLSLGGYGYQLVVALHWVIQMLHDDRIEYVQMESIGIPDGSDSVFIDDIVVGFKDKPTMFIQVKKNESGYSAWNFNSRVLREEFINAKKQLEASDGHVWFYSQSPFGNLHKLSERLRAYPSFSDFERDAPKNIQGFLRSLQRIMEVSAEDAYSLGKRVFYHVASMEDLEHSSLNSLGAIVADASKALAVLKEYLIKHAINHTDSPTALHRKDILDHLDREGFVLGHKRNERDILEAFRKTSSIGRPWIREVDGERIEFAELPEIVSEIENGTQSILVTGGPGSGKTCLFLDLADDIEANHPNWGLLFIKGDFFCHASSPEEMEREGLPSEIVEQCARLAEKRKTVVVLDSLDVLSLSRAHGVFRYFLSFIDRLKGIENLTVVIACREFDLKYDPELRRREWGKIVRLAHLDFDTVVVHFLKRWNIDPESLDERLKGLLCIPQNLQIYSAIARSDGGNTMNTTWDLYERYVEETVGKDESLGVNAFHALGDFAATLMHERVSRLPKVRFTEPKLLQRLVSQNVLVELDASRIGFAHQTLTENFIVRDAVADGIDLEQFIVSHPPLPFIRPVVRAFFFHLSSQGGRALRRALRSVIGNNNIAYHVKRLLVESFAELPPSDESWKFVQWLWREHVGLFRRLFWSVKTEEWFEFLVDKWLPVASVMSDWEKFKGEWADKLRNWSNARPEDVIAQWTALLKQFPDDSNLDFKITMALDSFKHWGIADIGGLLQLLVERAKVDRDFFGKPLSRWVEATDQGDELLWQYITSKHEHNEDKYPRLGDILKCQPHEFHTKDFLQNRFLNFPPLLTVALRWLDIWSEEEGALYTYEGFRTKILHDTEWLRVHSEGEMHVADGLYLMNAIKDALVDHALKNDSWWQENEPWLRESKEEGILYLLIQAYMVNPQENIDGIAHLICDDRLLRYGHLEYELSQLMNRSYHLLSPEEKERNQQAVMSIYEEEIGDGEKANDIPWISRHRYAYLINIPCIFRTEDSQAFIDSWNGWFGGIRPGPDKPFCGGMVRSPVSLDFILRLNDAQLLGLLKYYSDHPGDGCFSDHLMGGAREVGSTLEGAVAKNPKGYAPLVPVLVRGGVDKGLVSRIYGGIARHTQYRFGNLSPNNKEWEPVAPAPSGRELFDILSSGLSTEKWLWEELKIVGDMLEAMADVVPDKKNATKLFTFHRRLRIELSKIGSKSENAHIWREAAAALHSLVNTAAENGWSLPKGIPELLQEYAGAQLDEVSEWMLHYMPFTIYKYPDWGWDCFESIMAGLPVEKWGRADRCFYYNYRERTEAVLGYIDQMLDQEDDSGETAGTIATLMFVTGKLTEEEWSGRVLSGNEKVQSETVRVLVKNCDKQECSEYCLRGLELVFGQDSLHANVLSSFSIIFPDNTPQIDISHELILAYLECASKTDGRIGMFHFQQWLPLRVQIAPMEVLEYLEALVAGFGAKDNASQIYGSQDAIPPTLQVLLAEADESNDLQLINRVIAVQDGLLQLGFGGIEELYENYIEIES